jgi:ABC-type glutathione transport system ATPase component
VTLDPHPAPDERPLIPIRTASPVPSALGAPALLVDGVRKEYRVRGGTKVAVANVSCVVELGRTLAVVGESGAGKSTLAKVIAGLERPTAGRVLVAGRPPVTRGGVASPVQMVFQQPGESLDPFHSVGRSVAEPLHGMSRDARAERVRDLLGRVGINPSHATRRPIAFSGGQLQRIVLARALAADPVVLLCDEPTSALDVSVQAQIVNLLLDLQSAVGFACVLVTHDLSLVRVRADEVLVLRDGIVEERSPADSFFAGPASRYGAALLEANRQQSLRRVS